MNKFHKTLFLLFIIIIPFRSVFSQETFPVNGIYDKRHTTYAFTNATIYIDSKTRIDSAVLIIKDGLVVDAGVEPSAQGMEFQLGDHALHSQKEAAVGGGRVVDAVAVSDEALMKGAQVEQRIPVTAVAGQAGAFVT